MLNSDVADVPEDKRHRSARLGDLLFSIIPDIPVTENTASSIAIDVDTFSRDDEPGMMILKGNRIRVVSPISQIIRHLETPLATGRSCQKNTEPSLTVQTPFHSIVTSWMTGFSFVAIQ